MSDGGVGRRTLSWPRCALAGGVGLLTAGIVLLLLSAVLADQILPQGREGLAARGALLLGSAAAGFLSCRKMTEGKLLPALVSAGMMTVFLLFLGIFTTDTSVLNMSMLLDVICVIFGVLIGLLCTGARRGRRKRRRR